MNRSTSREAAGRNRCVTPRLFFLGRDSHGNWVVEDRVHRCGGLFSSRKEALKFALFENGNRPQAVVPVRGLLELDMGETVGAEQRARRIA